jgi:hypothetical protein
MSILYPTEASQVGLSNPGASFTVVDATVAFTTPNEVVTDTIFEKRIYIRAPGVRFQNCHLKPRGTDDTLMLYIDQINCSIILEDCEYGNDQQDYVGYPLLSSSAAVAGSYVECKRTYFHHVMDLPVGSETLYEDCFAHLPMLATTHGHVDLVQITGSGPGVWRRCYLDMSELAPESPYQYDDPEVILDGGGPNRPWFAKNDLSDISGDFLVEHCYLDGNGNYITQITNNELSEYSWGDHTVTIRYNHYGNSYLTNPHSEGEGVNVLWYGNRDAATSQLLLGQMDDPNLPLLGNGGNMLGDAVQAKRAKINGSETEITVTLDDPPVAGNLVVLALGVKDNDNGTQTPPGSVETFHFEPRPLSGHATSAGLYYEVSDGVTDSWTFDIEQDTVFGHGAILIAVEFTGPVASVVEDEVEVLLSTGTNNTFVFPAVTPVADNVLMVGVCYGDRAQGPILTLDNDFDIIVDSNGASGNQECDLFVIAKMLESPEEVDPQGTITYGYRETLILAGFALEPVVVETGQGGYTPAPPGRRNISPYNRVIKRNPFQGFSA